jgi:hypothetical protein
LRAISPPDRRILRVSGSGFFLPALSDDPRNPSPAATSRRQRKPPALSPSSFQGSARSGRRCSSRLREPFTARTVRRFSSPISSGGNLAEKSKFVAKVAGAWTAGRRRSAQAEARSSRSSLPSRHRKGRHSFPITAFEMLGLGRAFECRAEDCSCPCASHLTRSVRLANALLRTSRTRAPAGRSQ